jgi:hypothetical protein
MVPFDSEHPAPEYKERMSAAAIVRDAVEQKVLELLHGMGSTRVNADVYSELRLDSFGLDGQPVELMIHCADTVAHADLPPYIVGLSEGPRRLDGRFMNRHDYSVPDTYDESGVTRRDIAIGERLKFEPLKPKDYTQPVRLSQDAAEKVLKAFEEAGEKLKQEKELGLNDQPIGVPEARAVALIISRGQLHVEPPIEKKPYGGFRLPPNYLL